MTERKSPPPELHDWKPLVENLAGRRERALAMGGDEQLARQRSLGKLPVRERFDIAHDGIAMTGSAGKREEHVKFDARKAHGNHSSV